MQGLLDNGISLKHVRDIYGVIRTYPIRISNEMHTLVMMENK